MKLVNQSLALLVVAGLALLGSSGPAASDDAPGTVANLWQFEGYASICPAAGQAKTERRRLLLGLSGGAT